MSLKKTDLKKYRRIHQWLYYHFGKANKCENKDCLGNNTAYQYALIKGKQYEKKRENYMLLCQSCHRLYDNHSHTEATKEKISQSLRGRKINPKTTLGTDKNGVMYVFPSATIAAKSFNVCVSAISQAISKNRLSAGMKWEYI